MLVCINYSCIESVAIEEKKLERNPFIFFLVWMAIMAIPVFIYGDLTYTPWFVVYMFVSFTALFAVTGWWQHYLDKGKK